MKPKVVLADADAASAAALEGELKAAGYEALCAHTLEKAEALLERNACELVVCDLGVHPHDGRALVRRLRDRLVDGRTPLVLVSEERALAQRIDALRAGATDYLLKPAHVSHLTRIVRSLSAAEPGAPSRVLVVDDSATYGHALADELCQDGHDVVLAMTVAEARSYLSWQTPDLMLLDVFLPDGDGVELAKSLRSHDSTRELPILMLTGRESAKVRQRAADAQVSGFAAKDTPLAELRRTVRSLRDPGRPRSVRGNVASPAEVRVSSGKELFARVVAASGLSEVLGRSTLELALKRAGLEVQSLTPDTLPRALPHIEQALVTFLKPQDARTRLAAVAALAAESSPPS